MKEQQQDIKNFSFLQLFIYIYICIDVLYHYLVHFLHHSIWYELYSHLKKLSFLDNIYSSHLVATILAMLIGLATKSKKNVKYKPFPFFWLPLVIGVLLNVTSIVLYNNSSNSIINIYDALYYTLTYMCAIVFTHIAFANLSKRIPKKLKEDIWNDEEESFMQNQDKVDLGYTFNVPMQFYYNKKLHQGWINCDVFRGSLVFGVPGSGKSASIIEPFIRQSIGKGFATCVYDFKFPTLANIAYYHHRLNKVQNPTYNKKFYVLNIDEVEKSIRVNPIHKKYINTLADATETAEAIYLSLSKGENGGGGASQFFTQSAINFLSAVIYFLRDYEDGRFCTLPHVIATITLPYDQLFQMLFTNDHIYSLLTPFKSAYDNEAFEQLEGQIGTVRINISKLATQESFWIFSGDDLDFKISNIESPVHLILANNPNTLSINSAFFSAVLLRLNRQINQKGNLPSAIIIDEAPTVYLHKIETLIATARSNKVAVMLGIQSTSQLVNDYGEKKANVITDIMGSVFSGAVRSKNTLEWLQTILGKVKQVSTGLSINRDTTSISMNEKLDFLVPSAKIANLKAGEMVAVVSPPAESDFGTYKPNVFKCKVIIDWDKIKQEVAAYSDTPIYYKFSNAEKKEAMLKANFKQIYKDVQEIANKYYVAPMKKEKDG